MRTLRRNMRRFWYCLYDGVEEIYDELGNATGEYIPKYSAPKEMYANISPATGSAQTEQFGNLADYDKVIVTDCLCCPIDENSVLFIDKKPEYTVAKTNSYIKSETLLGEDEVTTESVDVPAYDYIVRRVARSINSVSIAVRKVTVS